MSERIDLRLALARAQRPVDLLISMLIDVLGEFGSVHSYVRTYVRTFVRSSGRASLPGSEGGIYGVCRAWGFISSD